MHDQTKEALELALAALLNSGVKHPQQIEPRNKALDAIRAVLAQQPAVMAPVRLQPLPSAWGVFHDDGGAHIFQQKEAAAIFGEPAALYKALTADQQGPIHGDVLPPVGSRVFIRHGRDDDAHACTVTGYYAWKDLGGKNSLHRLFVRVVYEGTNTPNARLLCECWPTAQAALDSALQPAAPLVSVQPATGPDEIRLKPCPFCGCALDARWSKCNPKARCVTEGCKGAQLPVTNLDDPQDIEKWNRRARQEQHLPMESAAIDRGFAEHDSTYAFFSSKLSFEEGVRFAEASRGISE